MLRSSWAGIAARRPTAPAAATAASSSAGQGVGGQAGDGTRRGFTRQLEEDGFVTLQRKERPLRDAAAAELCS